MNFVPLKTDLVGQPTGRLNFLTPDECRTIIANGENSLELKVSRTEDHRVHESVRSSEIGWLNPDPEHTWLFNRIKDCINDVNAQWFGYALIGFEGIQFTKYSFRKDRKDGPPDFYSSHRDTTLLPGGTVRKLSLTVQLSDSGAYDGGDVVLYNTLSDPIPLSRAQGSISFFPSYTIHEVTPVTRGIRYSLVGWACGPAFV
jgi:PKHD-type hydroxylase